MVLNSQQLSSLYKIEPGTLQGSILGLLFFIYIEYLYDGLTTNTKKKKKFKNVKKNISLLTETAKEFT